MYVGFSDNCSIIIDNWQVMWHKAQSYDIIVHSRLPGLQPRATIPNISIKPNVKTSESVGKYLKQKLL